MPFSVYLSLQTTGYCITAETSEGPEVPAAATVFRAPGFGALELLITLLPFVPGIIVVLGGAETPGSIREP